MNGYIDMFVLPVPKKHLRAYCRTSQRYGRIMREYGALEYREFLEEDLEAKGVGAFPSRIRLKSGEVLVSSVIGFRSKAHRDQVYLRVQVDPRAQRMRREFAKNPITDLKRTLHGGFSTIVKV